jgi:hypothetical protein
MANENLPSANVIYVEDFSWSYSQDEIPRTGISPGHPGGWKSEAGTKHLSFSFTCEIRPQTITTANDADAPNIDPIFRGGGFVRTSVASTTDTHAYVLDPANHESFWMEFYAIDEDNADGNKVIFPGCRCSLSFTFDPGGRIMCSVSGLAVYNAAAGVTSIGAGAATLTYSSDEAVMARAATLQWSNVDNSDAMYGGGSLASPGNAVLVRSLTIDCNMNPVERMGLTATNGVGGIRLAPSGPPMASGTYEAVEVDDFDPWAIRAAKQSMHNRLIFPAPTGTTTTTTVLFYGQIVGEIDESEADVRTWSIDQAMRYPEDAVGGSPAVGVAPTQAFTAGTNQGLPLAVAGITSGVLAFLFTTPQ